MSDSVPNFLTPLDIDRIRMGDANATADGIRLLYEAINAEILARSQIVGPWKNVPYVATDFLAAGGTWTVDEAKIADFKYLKFGTMIILAFNFNRVSAGLQSTVVTGGLSLVGVRIPELRAKLSKRGDNADGSGFNGCYISDNTGVAAGVCYVTRKWNASDEPAAVLNVEVASGRNFDSTTVGLSVFGFCLFEIEG